MKIRVESIAILCCLVSPLAIRAFGQRPASAAKGGSPAREIVREPNSLMKDSEKYHAAVDKLGLDYNSVVTRFEEVRSETKSQSFRNVLTAYLVVRKSNPADFDVSVSRVIDLMKKRKSLDSSLRLALQLDSETLRRRKREAKKQLKSAAGF